MKHINQRQAADAMALLREYVALLDGKSMSAQPTDFWTTRVEKLVREVDSLRGRAAYQRWCIGRDGRGFRAGDFVIFGTGKTRKVSKIDPETQFFWVHGMCGNFFAKTVIKQSPSVATPEELEEIGQEVMRFEAGLRGGAAA